MKIVLNEDQKAASDFIINRLIDKDELGVTVVGEGGTGKTTSIMHAVDRLKAAGMNVLLTAPTNKAANKLYDASIEYGSNNQATTLAKALGLALLPDRENKRAHKLGSGLIEPNMVIVADEASMISSEALYNHLLPSLQANNAKVIFMGDKFQLPPVKEFRSPALEEFDKVQLSKVERQKEGSPILEICRSMRESLEFNTNFICGEVPVTSVKAAMFVDSILDSYTNHSDCKHTRALAWTNARVADLTMYIRKKLFGRDVEAFVVGERVATGSPVIEESIVVIPTDIECIVSSVTLETVEYKYAGNLSEFYTCYSIVITPEGNYAQCFVTVLHDTELERANAKLNAIAEKAKRLPRGEAFKLWKEYHHFKDFFATLKHCYAMTVHRSQGSTYEKVFVDISDIQRCPHARMRKQLAYVACSRPSTELVLNKTKFEL